jgi:hypothetical protein
MTTEPVTPDIPPPDPFRSYFAGAVTIGDMQRRVGGLEDIVERLAEMLRAHADEIQVLRRRVSVLERSIPLSDPTPKPKRTGRPAARPIRPVETGND